jgi:hypothetical protein
MIASRTLKAFLRSAGLPHREHPELAEGRSTHHGIANYLSLTSQRGLIQGSWLERGSGSRPRM